MSVYHPDIMKFINAKDEEGRMHTTNISVVVDDLFMNKVINDEDYQTFFDGKNGRLLGPKYKARAIFNKLIDGAWSNGEPGILFYNSMNNSPYKYSKQEILATNPCLSGDTLIQTVEGHIKIKDLVGKEIDVYCMSDDGMLEISKAFNIRQTKKNAKLVRVQTSRGHIICTPDHKFFTKNRGYVEAKDLTRKDRIVGLNRKLHGEHYCSIALTGNKIYEKEHRFIMRHYQDISDKDVHHVDRNYLNNVKSNLEVLDHKYHSSITNLGHIDWNEHGILGYFLPKTEHKRKIQYQLDDGNPKGLNLCILGVEELNYTEDVYDLEVETYHNFIANGIVVHNCGEQPLPPNGVCNLGSLDISKFLNEDKSINLELLELAINLSINFLDLIVSESIYPTKDITKWAKNNRPVGLGIMGLADYYLIRGVSYGSPQALEELEFIMSFMYEIANIKSIELGQEKGVPNACKKLPQPRRNITVLSIAPTGTISLIAGCNSGIEPIFSEITVRNDKTGQYTFNNISSDADFFRCAVSANGAKEVTWEEHVNTQASAQKFVDSGVSKTINFPNYTHRETIYNAFILAWQLGCKGLTIYRNGSRRVEVLSPKNLKKDLCPECGSELIRESNCKHCTNTACGWSMCDVS